MSGEKSRVQMSEEKFIVYALIIRQTQINNWSVEESFEIIVKTTT